MESFVTSHVLGTALRGVTGGKMANMAMENDDDALMESTVQLMKEQAAAVTADKPGIIRRPEETEIVESARTWKRPGNELISEVLASLEKKILAADPRIIQVTDISWNEETTVREIVNSYGMNVKDSSTMQLIVGGAAAMENSEVKNDYNFELIEDLDAFDQDAFVKKLADKVLSKLGASGMKSGTYPVILEKEAMTGLFTAFAGMFSGELIAKGISPVKDLQGEKIFSDLISVVDDPRNQDAAQIACYDDEGCPTAKKTVVDKGIFALAMQDSVSAARNNTESTGNGFKASYASAVDVRPMNCYIVPGEKTLDELCAEMKEGLVITSLQGLHAGVDFITTNFSLQCSGYYVRDGVRDHSVTLITVAGNFLELMKNAAAVGNDLEWDFRSVRCPSVYFKGCAISGE
jgi:PmbA protein